MSLNIGCGTRLKYNRAALLLVAMAVGWGQGKTGAIRGRVTDPSGRVVPGVVVRAFGPGNGKTLAGESRSASDGRYEIQRLEQGSYTIRANVKGFAPFESTSRAPEVVDIALSLAQASDRVTVSDEAQVEVSAENNASALVLKGPDLEALSDDRDDFTNDLLALAGPAAGPNGGQVFIDGFTGGRMPPKSSIREVRINQNPFSAQYDRLGYGRVEVFTKPGADDFHGEFVFVYGNDIFNSRNPFSPVKPPYERRQWEGEVGGPLGKKTSFLTDFEVRRTTEDAFINALTLDPQFNIVPVAEGVVTPLRGTEFNFRLDRQVAANQTLTVRYGHQRDERDNQGVGGFSLASRAYGNSDQEDSIQATETGVYGTHLVNETRFRYLRLRGRQEGNADQPTISVLDAFTGGGPPVRLSFNNQDRYELQNVTSYAQGKHVWRFGGRFRGVGLRDQDTQNYTGTFTFSSLASYGLTLRGLANHLSGDQIRQSGGGASQFSLAGGDPLAQVNQYDVGVFLQDDWRLRANMTLSVGLRYEKQTNISDSRDVAPRVALAWGLGPKNKPAKTVLRAGGGVFYDRLGENLTLDGLRQDGIHQQRFVVQSPDFYPVVPTLGQLQSGRVSQAIREVDRGIVAPRILQGSFGLERALPKKILISTNYVHTQSLHQLRSRNINAPIGGELPYGGSSAIYLYEASGRFRQDQWITSVNAKIGGAFSLTGSYTLGKASSDTDGAGTFPSNSYDLRPEYGRAGFDIRHRVQMNGSFGLPLGLRISPLLVATSGRPFNITTGSDLNGDTLFTDRPSLATDLSRPGVVRTAYGNFDLAQQPGQPIVPRNFGNGPAQFALNTRLTKTFEIGKEGKSPGGKAKDPKELIFSVSARNVLNHPNLGLPVGNLSSLLFGQSTSLAGGQGGGAAGNRRLDLQVKFAF